MFFLSLVQLLLIIFDDLIYSFCQIALLSDLGYSVIFAKSADMLMTECSTICLEFWTVSSHW